VGSVGGGRGRGIRGGGLGQKPIKAGNVKHMPLRREVEFLRARARRVREMADAHQTGLSDQLRMIAAELEARADELERTRAED
jgi:hypothetical protein